MCLRGSLKLDSGNKIGAAEEEEIRGGVLDTKGRLRQEVRY